ncbi:zinc-ribbon-domain-containing protein, partial [Paraphysoderma sedebokerense]
FGCKHYMRSVKLQSHCCGKWVVCRFCHDEVSDHAIVRQKTKLMMCMKCFHVQPCSQFCTNPECNAKVSRYYCNECKLWDDDPKKNIYHCYDCGICRIGKGLGQDYFHCKKCNVCMAISLKDKHKCIERNLESDCPICGEYMFTSTTTVIFMPCGHCIHHKCYQEHIQNSYTCPTCCKSLGNMTEYFNRIDQALAQHRMPPEYEDMLSFVFCNDCEKRSKAKYHFVYHKCGKCGSYNTKILSTMKKGSNDEAVVDEKLAKWDAEAKACASGAGSPSCSSPICNSNSSSVSNLQSPSSPTTSTTSLSSGSPMPINQERRNSETTSSTTTFISNPLNGSTDLPGSYPNGTLPTSTSQTSPSRTN